MCRIQYIFTYILINYFFVARWCTIKFNISNKVVRFMLQIKIDNIVEDETKQYIPEVISSFNNHNYRSAVVSLYSVLITDLYLKLQTLIDEYEDEEASKRNDELKKMKQEDASRENRLIDFFTSRSMFNPEVQNAISNLKNYRNISAHPNFRAGAEKLLITPNEQIVSGLIQLLTEDVFSKIAFLGNSSFEFLLSDSERYWNVISGSLIGMDFITNYQQFLRRKFFDKMSDHTKVYYVRQLIKIVFISKSPEADKNRIINLETLKCLLINSNISSDDLRKMVERIDIETSEDPKYLFLLNLLFNFGDLYKNLLVSVQQIIKSDSNYNLYTWYAKKGTINEMNSPILDILPDGDIKHLNLIKKSISEDKLSQQILILGINKYAQSGSFDEADNLFSTCIEPFINDMTEENVDMLITKVGSNSQVLYRGRKYNDHNKILNHLSSIVSEEKTEEFKEQNETFWK